MEGDVPYAGLDQQIVELAKAVRYMVEKVAPGMPDERQLSASPWHEFHWEDGLQDAYHLMMKDPILKLLKPAIYKYAVKMSKESKGEK